MPNGSDRAGARLAFIGKLARLAQDGSLRFAAAR
jgi:hypothetical protein